MAQNYQGGKAYGLQLKRREVELDEINKQFQNSGNYDDVEELEAKLLQYKAQFIRFDLNGDGGIDDMELKQMLEKLEQPKTHLECKKMVQSIDSTSTGMITYADFLIMMLGGKNSVLRMILIFEEKAKPKLKPEGMAKKRSLADLGIRPEMAQHLG